jgi:hypothetical protein
MEKFSGCDALVNSEKETPYELCPIHYTHLCVCVCGACVGVGVAQYTDCTTGLTIGVRIPTEKTVFLSYPKHPDQLCNHAVGTGGKTAGT